MNEYYHYVRMAILLCSLHYKVLHLQFSVIEERVFTHT